MAVAVPRRVPWASMQEFEQVCSWIFQDEYDIDSAIKALNRMAAWRAVTTLPHALESTMSILAVIVQDKSAEASSTSSLSIRQSYASAIIRFVNGFVDPLQQGAFARSIASLAQQIGLPSWLVELRHAATHEDLPSLFTLRDAARQAMSWLLHNYFLPTLGPSKDVARPAPYLRPVYPLLKRYKTLMKSSCRDTSLKSQSRSEVTSIFREIERWIAEAKLAAVDPSSLIASPTSDLSEDEISEIFALERLCYAFWVPGALIPLSKSKRHSPADNYFPSQFLLDIWSPLIASVENVHSQFLPTLCASLVGSLAGANDTSDDSRFDASYFDLLARWIFWVIDYSEKHRISNTGDSNELTLDAVVALLNVSKTVDEAKPSQTAAQNLLSQLWEGVSSELLISLKTVRSDDPLPSEWSPESLDIMKERMQAVIEVTNVHSIEHPSEKAATASAPTETVHAEAILPGWQLCDNAQWAALPIGVHQD